MRGPILTLALLVATAAPGAAAARTAAVDLVPNYPIGGATQDEALPYLQCVPYARAVSGIQIRGDALTWWSQAAGRYARGNRPQVGAVMSFRPYGAMRLGHVAAVSRVIDSRTVLLRHANWSPIDGRRGQIENDVRAVDVSPGNDWSAVRVWYAPLGGLGTTHWPVDGFIYNRRPRPDERLAVLASTDAPAQAVPAFKSRIGADFLRGIVPEQSGNRTAVGRGGGGARGRRPPARAARLANDPIGRIIASRTR